MCVQWCTQLILVRYWSLWCPVPVFKGFKTLIWIHHEFTHESKIPFLTMFITSSRLLLILKLKEYQDYLVTGEMFTPVNKTFIRDLCNSWPRSMWTFNSWTCAKGKDVKLQSSYPERDVIQTYMEMTVFFVSSFTINTFNSLAERQAKFKIVHIWKLFHTLC